MKHAVLALAGLALTSRAELDQPFATAWPPLMCYECNGRREVDQACRTEVNAQGKFRKFPVANCTERQNARCVKSVMRGKYREVLWYYLGCSPYDDETRTPDLTDCDLLVIQYGMDTWEKNYSNLTCEWCPGDYCNARCVGEYCEPPEPEYIESDEANAWQASTCAEPCAGHFCLRPPTAPHTSPTSNPGIKRLCYECNGHRPEDKPCKPGIDASGHLIPFKSVECTAECVRITMYNINSNSTPLWFVLGCKQDSRETDDSVERKYKMNWMVESFPRTVYESCTSNLCNAKCTDTACYSHHPIDVEVTPITQSTLPTTTPNWSRARDREPRFRPDTTTSTQPTSTMKIISIHRITTLPPEVIIYTTTGTTTSTDMHTSTENLRPDAGEARDAGQELRHCFGLTVLSASLTLNTCRLW